MKEINSNSSLQNSLDGIQGEDTKKNVTPIKINPDFSDLINPTTILNHVEELEQNHQTIRNKYKIDVREEIPPPQIAWSLTNTKSEGEATLGTLGDFGMIIGKAKSRKSFFINIAVSTALGNDLILERFKSYLPKNQNKVAYFDTEQSKYYVQKAVKRICTQINEPEPQNLDTFHLRSLNPPERLKFIEDEIYNNTQLGFVVIDGIKDLVTSINDEEQATMIASKLLKWSEERNIYILVVLHQNKSDTNARGHIGTELMNKAQTVLSITKDEDNKDISIVEPQQCRDKEPETFAFSIDDNGLPFLVSGFEPAIKKISNSFSVTDLEDFKKYQLLNEVFSHDKEYKYGALVSQLKIAYKNQLKKDLGDNRIKDLVTYCKNKGWLIQSDKKQPYTLGEYQDNQNSNEKDIDF